MIVIDKVVTTTGNNTTLSVDINVASQDAVLVILATGASQVPAGPTTVNGVPITALRTGANGSGAALYYVLNPNVGINTITTVNGIFQVGLTVVSLLGVNKKSLTPATVVATYSAASTFIASVSVPTANSLLLDVITVSNALTGSLQTQIANTTTNLNHAASYKIVPAGDQTMGWISTAGSGAEIIIVLEPAQAPSISFPNVTLRSQNDVARPNALDASGSTPFGTAGYFPSQFFQNSFLHTVGRIGDPNVFVPSRTVNFNNTSQITIDRITQFQATSMSIAVDHQVLNPNSVLVVFQIGSSGTITGSTFNGSSLTNLGTGNTLPKVGVYYMVNPPVGTYTLTTDLNTNALQSLVAITLSGVNIEALNPNTFVSTYSSTTPSTLVTPASPNSLVIDMVTTSANSRTEPTAGQTVFIRSQGGSLWASAGISVLSSPKTLSWSLSTSGSYVAIVLEPAHAPSIYFPKINTRNLLDIVSANSLDTTQSTTNGNYGYFPANFWLNSFLHTIGRLSQPAPSAGTVVAETEQETSQIIIDKIFQGQLASTPLTINTLNMDISIPSPDAVLVVTGGSVIATGGAWGGVQLNGNPLTKLVQAGVAGQSAEIWFLPFPTVGVNTLSIQSASGGEIYANAMVILGVDKRSTNIMTASATDAASTTTIGALITPDAPNSLIIDAMATLNATTFPIQDSSQTQVFNASALASSEYLLSSYKIASAAQNMNYNLSVAVNASLVAVAFRPANAFSQWFPSIDFRTLDDVITVAGLDSEVNPSFGQYGYKASMFYLNSFLHTVGRYQRITNPVASSSGSTLLMMGIS